VKFAAGEFIWFADNQYLLNSRKALQGFADRWINATGSCSRARRANGTEDADYGTFDSLGEMAAQSVDVEELHYVFNSFVFAMRLHYDNHEGCSFSFVSDEWFYLAPFANSHSGIP
jgi:hypothetical protein